MRRRVLSAVYGTLLVGSALLSGCASVANTAYPPIQADRTPEALKRGESIFRGACEGCHRGPDSQRVTGAPMKDAPGWLGTLYTANLTSHPTTGIGSAKDEELARVIRYGVSRDGRLIPMPSSIMGDKDLAAVLGFMRSQHPLFEPDATVAPRTDFSFLGGLAFGLVTRVPDHPASGMPVPPKGPTVEYGRYMASVLDCGGCHTDSLDPEAANGSKGYSGGREFLGADGKPIRSANITFDATGLQGWSLEDFTRAVRDGLAPGAIVRYPMPRYRGADDVDMQAMYEFLRSLPLRRHEVPGARPHSVPAPGAPSARVVPASTSTQALEPGSPVRTSAPARLAELVLAQAEPKKDVDPAALFARLGCTLCHAPGARYHDRIAKAAGKSEQELAKWIRNPEQFVPGTTMPTYASLVDEPTALALAKWIKAGGPSSGK
ncbi:c-type cytochrome [Vitiosangium sp. GDMCC 1.1324]|uniref:c-type cytochrome n=1 Tax=Vitiosangium sp. (strain GDMCC 1.1324) TaxID=2138576 RepID=UPI000D349C67|nr:c-type cytochrome [Vitiosangium sp. GDMCC 1.1324]PTL84485.1 cytochrome C [Vitiosangium sp. GDMCC 1.1324]